MADRDLTPPDAVIVLFGGNGDLARRKLIPSLWDLHRAGLMPEQWVLIGASRSDMADEAYGEFAREALLEFDREVSADDEDAFTEFASHLRYRGGGFDADDPSRIADAVAEAEQEMGGEPTRLFYLAVPPSAFGPITEGIGAAGLDQRARVVFEKPFGTDAESFAELDDTVRSVLTEEQIYRIDHFLGKETLQNVLALRFANGMFEPVW
ncbi:MAG: glucose-6-phosphate dehydrogenase, partial [Actinomycetota bacterium]